MLNFYTVCLLSSNIRLMATFTQWGNPQIALIDVVSPVADLQNLHSFLKTITVRSFEYQSQNMRHAFFSIKYRCN